MDTQRTVMEIGLCSCPTGLTGAACRHQAAVAKNYKLATVNVAPKKLDISMSFWQGEKIILMTLNFIQECIPPLPTVTTNKHTYMAL